MRVVISFAGSFQCRLATNPDDTKLSPTTEKKFDPVLGGKGWTFAYDEPRLDRVVRLSNPVRLRNALVDPWEDARVTKVESSAFDLHQALKGAPDPLIGEVVSLGDAKLDEKAGGGMGYEVLVDFGFSIGGMKFTAEQAVPTRMTGITPVPEWETEYLKTKPARLGLNGDGTIPTDPRGALAMMHPKRRELLLDRPDKVDGGGILPMKVQVTYRSFFGMKATMPKIPLKNVSTSGGALQSVHQRPASLAWTLSLTFGRFDGDTLTGRIWGELEGVGA